MQSSFNWSAVFNLSLHSSSNKDSCNGEHFSAKKLNAPIVILLLLYCTELSGIYANTAFSLFSGDPWPLGRQAEPFSLVVWEAMHLLVDEGAHYPERAQSAIHERASGASLFLRAHRRSRDESISSGCVYIRLHCVERACSWIGILQSQAVSASARPAARTKLWEWEIFILPA